MQQDNAKQFKKFKKFPLIVAILFLIASCVGFWFVLNKINANEAISGETQSRWQAEAIRREGIRSLERSIKDIQSEKNLLETHFAESSNVVPFLDTLESLARQAGAVAEVTSVDIVKDKSELSVAIHVSGGFGSVFKFTQLVENAPYEIVIDSFDLEKEISTGEVGGGAWDGFFTLRLLSFTK